MRAIWLAFIALPACSNSASELCRDFERAACEPIARCNGATITDCLRVIDEELRCADVVDVTGDVEECIADTRALACDDVDDAETFQLAPSCDDVVFR
jgi:hypothetical protein